MTVSSEINEIDEIDEINEIDSISSYNPPSAHYSQVTCDMSDKQIKKLIGKNGFYFNVITKASKVNYLWFDNQRKVIEIWGPMDHLEDAKKRLITRMQDIASMKCSVV